MSRHGFHTGDYASADREGFLHYQGRRDDIFKSAGEKVSAKEIEDVAMAHEAVGDAAAIAVSDPVLGAVPVLYIVLRPGMSCTERELQSFCARHLSRHKVPRRRAFCRGVTQDRERQGSEIPAQGSAPVKSGPLASVVTAVTVPWGCWHPEATLELSFPSRFSVQVNGMRDGHPLSAAALAEAVRQPLDSKPLRELAASARTAVIAVDDITRPTPVGEVLPILLSELAASRQTTSKSSWHSARIVRWSVPSSNRSSARPSWTRSTSSSIIPTKT